MPRQRIHHSRRTYELSGDFPQRLVRFKEESKLPWAEINRRLGTHPETVRRWRDKGVWPNTAEHDGAEGPGELAGSRPPVHRLRRPAAPGRETQERPRTWPCGETTPHCITGTAAPSWRHRSRRSRNGAERSPRPIEKSRQGMDRRGPRPDAAHRYTLIEVRATGRSLRRPSRPFPQLETHPIARYQDKREERHGRGAWRADRGEPSEDCRRFRRMMDGMDREGLRRMVERLTEEIGANPQDTPSPGRQGAGVQPAG